MAGGHPDRYQQRACVQATLRRTPRRPRGHPRLFVERTLKVPYRAFVRRVFPASASVLFLSPATKRGYGYVGARRRRKAFQAP